MLPSSVSTVPGETRKEDTQSQTESAAQESYVYTSTCVSCNTLRKKKIQEELIQCRKKIKIEEAETQKESSFH